MQCIFLSTNVPVQWWSVWASSQASIWALTLSCWQYSVLSCEFTASWDSQHSLFLGKGRILTKSRSLVVSFKTNNSYSWWWDGECKNSLAITVSSIRNSSNSLANLTTICRQLAMLIWIHVNRLFCASFCILYLIHLALGPKHPPT